MPVPPSKSPGSVLTPAVVHVTVAGTVEACTRIGKIAGTPPATLPPEHEEMPICGAVSASLIVPVDEALPEIVAPCGFESVIVKVLPAPAR